MSKDTGEEARRRQHAETVRRIHERQERRRADYRAVDIELARERWERAQEEAAKADERTKDLRMSKVVAIMSGGMDSTVLGYLLKEQGFELEAVSVNYGQRHWKELQYAEQVAGDLDIPWHLVDLTDSGLPNLLTGSALTDPEVEVPEGHYEAESMSMTIVPNRNAIMLSIAAAIAYANDGEMVATAVHSGDHAIYPDCRPEFIGAFEDMERWALDRIQFQVIAPFIRMPKSDIVLMGSKLGVPFERTWSCYKGEAIHCGACGTCYERREAFQRAAVPDPTEYAATPAFKAP